MKAKKAFATRTSGNVYDVNYEGSRDLDRDVPSGYIKRLVEKGYTVTVDNSKYRCEGDPKIEILEPTK